MLTPSVLIADDQPHVVDALRLLLKERYRVAVAASPTAVLKAIACHAYDAVLMDLNYARDTTSGQEGLELVAEIRRHDRHVPIVVMTAWSTVGLAVAVMQRGAADFIEKPWDNQRLLTVLGAQIQLGQAARQTARLEFRLHQDLQLAAQVQSQLLPRVMPATGSVRWAGRCIPAREVGGDYYDLIPLPHGTVGIVVADIAGKGVAAALLMANLQAMLRIEAGLLGHDPAALAAALNARLRGTMPGDRYVTLFYGTYDERSRRLAYVNAGHNPPLLLRAGGAVDRLSVGGPGVGAFEDARYDAGATTIAPEDRLVVFTDGITDALDGQEQEFGECRLIDAVRDARQRPPAEMLEQVLAAHAAFVGAAPPADDITLLVVGAD